MHRGIQEGFPFRRVFYIVLAGRRILCNLFLCRPTLGFRFTVRVPLTSLSVQSVGSNIVQRQVLCRPASTLTLALSSQTFWFKLVCGILVQCSFQQCSQSRAENLRNLICCESFRCGFGAKSRDFSGVRS